MSPLATRSTLLALATGVLVAGSLPATAGTPTRTAWYTALSAGPLTAPALTAEGDLRVAGTGSAPTAYAALALPSSEGSGGALVLAVRSGSAGTVELAACPTKAADWEAGGNQPFEDGPEYDCVAGFAAGTLSGDGTSVSFSLDSSLQRPDGSYSVAIAPLPESTTPFQVDLGEPQFTPGEAFEVPAEEPAAEEPAAEQPAGGSGTAEPPALDSGFEAAPDDAPAPEPLVDDAPAPELPGLESEPGTTSAAEEPLPAPETADEAVATAVLPGAQLAAGEDPVADGPRLLALLTLIGVSAGAGYAAGQQRTQPRLIGGRARALPAGGPTPGAALAVRADDEPAVLPRGIGRFSRVRDAAPRRLR